MSSSITLSAATRQNLLSLQDTANLLATTQNRLSTGKSVNTALDNPVNFFTSQALSGRSSALSTLLDGVSNGIQTIQAANQGITNIQKLTDQLKSTAQQALAASNSFTSKDSVASSDVKNVSADDIVGGTYTENTVEGTAVQNKLATPANITMDTKLSGSTAADRLDFKSNDTLSINGQTITFVSGTAAAGTNQVSLDGSVQDLLDKIDSLSGADTAASIAGGKITLSTGTKNDLKIAGSSNALAQLGLSEGTTERTAPTDAQNKGALTVTVGTGTSAKSATITLGGSGVTTLDQLNTQLSSIGAQASIDSSGNLAITTSNESGAKDISIKGAAAQSGFGAADATTAVDGSGLVLGGDGKTARDKLVNDYNNLRTQIDQLAKDSSFNGVNLLNGDTLKVIFNETNTSSLSVKGTALSADSLGLSAVGSTDFQDATSINKVLGQLTSANSLLNSQAATYGSNLSVVQNRQDFTKGLINVLDTGSANLTNADMNAEAANSQALSTRNSLGISALSLANQAQQGILQLLR
jgi:flagellin-like hook-associated protein FlgL